MLSWSFCLSGSIYWLSILLHWSAIYVTVSDALFHSWLTFPQEKKQSESAKHVCPHCLFNHLFVTVIKGYRFISNWSLMRSSHMLILEEANSFCAEKRFHNLKTVFLISTNHLESNICHWQQSGLGRYDTDGLENIYHLYLGKKLRPNRSTVLPS